MSKAEYLKKYLPKDDSGGVEATKIARKNTMVHSILDDDIDSPRRHYRTSSRSPADLSPLGKIGKYAEPETVYRDEAGRRIDLKLERREEERRKIEENAMFLEWGRG